MMILSSSVVKGATTLTGCSFKPEGVTQRPNAACAEIRANDLSHIVAAG
jgi:hypothetical protein